VAAHHRERVTIDLRGLGEALRARARADSTTLSALARRAVVDMLGCPEVAKTGSSDRSTHADDHQLVKVTIRLPRGVAGCLATRAHATGLSHGGYVRSLIDGVRVPPACDVSDAVEALAASTSELAMLTSDLHRLVRLVHGESSPSIDRLKASLAILEDDVRSHLGRASRLIAQLQPRAALGRSCRLAKAEATL
jgi:hypothetical protein